MSSAEKWMQMKGRMGTEEADLPWDGLEGRAGRHACDGCRKSGKLPVKKDVCWKGLR